MKTVPSPRSPVNSDEIRLFSQLPDDAHERCRGLQRSRIHVLAALASWADRHSHAAWCSVSALAKACGIHRGTASRARRDLAEVGAIEPLHFNRRGAWLVRLVFRSAARAQPTQKPPLSRSRTLGARYRLEAAIRARLDSGVRNDPLGADRAKRRAKWLVQMRNVPVSEAMRDEICELATPGWRGSVQALERRGVSVVMADLLGRAFAASRVDSVLAYCDRCRYREGGIVAALLNGWSTG